MSNAEISSEPLSTASKCDGKAAWKQRSDRGPHTATLPSGQRVTFLIPDTGALIRSGRLPEQLKRLALLCAAHPDGPEGYMEDLLAIAIRQGRLEETLERSIQDGLELSYHLISEMVVEPAVSVDDVRSGELPELDLRMLMQFAERKRNLDADGNRLPILLLDEWATFRGQHARRESPAAGTSATDEPRPPVPDPGPGEL